MFDKYHSCFMQNFMLAEEFDAYRLSGGGVRDGNDGDSAEPENDRKLRKHRLLFEFRNYEEMNSFINDHDSRWKNPLVPDNDSADTVENTENAPDPDSPSDPSDRTDSMQKPQKNFEFLMAYQNKPVLFLKADFEFLIQCEKDPRIAGIHLDVPLFLCMNEVRYRYNIDSIHQSFFRIRGKGIRIGIMDTGIDRTHPDLRNSVMDILNVTNEDDGDFNGHGTFLAGIIAGSGVMSDGYYTGIAPESKLMDIKIFDGKGRAYLSDALLALDLLNSREKPQLPDILLLGFTTGFIDKNPPPRSADNDTHGPTNLLGSFLKNLSDKGIIIVAPIGNFGPESGLIPSSASPESVISVGTIDEKNRMKFFSGRGIIINRSAGLEGNVEESAAAGLNNGGNDVHILGKPDFAVIGTDVVGLRAFFSPESENGVLKGYTMMSGTSISAAIFAGMLALLKQSFPKMSPAELIGLVKEYSTAIDRSDTDDTAEIGLKILIPNIHSILKKKNRILAKPISWKSTIKYAIWGAFSTFSVLMGIYLIFMRFFN